MVWGSYFHRFWLFRAFSAVVARSNLRLSDAFYLNLLAVIIGILVGGFAYVFKFVVVSGGDLIRGDGNGNQLAFFTEHPWLILVMPALGGLIVGLIFHLFQRKRQFRGVAAVMESVARRGGKLSKYRGAFELLNTAIGMVSGLSVGMEGPIVVAGSTTGSNISDAFHLSAARRRVLLACGAAAGISAVFNAPIAGFFFALELILGDFAKKAVAAIVLASVSGNVTIQMLTKQEPVFKLPTYEVVHLAEIANYAVLGVVCGLVAYVFAQFLHKCDDFFPKLKISLPIRTMLGGLLVGAIAFIFPEILGTGHHTIETLLNGHFPENQHLMSWLRWDSPYLYLIALAFAKLAATSITLGSGAAGGKFAPSLFIGATIGAVFGSLVSIMGLTPTENPAAYALVGMAAIFGSIAQVPLAVILLVFEMTRDYHLILPMMVAGIMSQVIFYSLRKEGVFTHKLTQLGVKFGRGKDLNILEAIPVGDVMHLGVETISATDTLAEITARFSETQHHGFPIVDEQGLLCGMFTTSDLAAHKADAPDSSALDLCTHDVFRLNEDDNCHQAIAILEDHHIGRIPVVDSAGKPVGIITRTDIIGAYKLALQQRAKELEEQGG